MNSRNDKVLAGWVCGVGQSDTLGEQWVRIVLVCLKVLCRERKTVWIKRQVVARNMLGWWFGGQGWENEFYFTQSLTHTQSSRHFNSLRKDVNVMARPVIFFHVFAWGTLRTCLEMVGKTQNLSIESEWTNQIWSLTAGSMQLVCQVWYNCC